MKKLQLHWQILIAFVLAILLGSLFPTQYIIEPDTIDSHTNIVVDDLPLKNDTVFQSQQALVTFLQNREIPYEAQQDIVKESYHNPVISFFSWFGDMFIRLLKMITIPLIVTSIICGVANMGNAGNLGRIGIKTFGYYIMSSFLAIVTGLFLVNTLKPGVGAKIGSFETPELAVADTSLSNLLLRIVPTNIFNALSSADMLAIIFFTIVFGFFITRITIKYKDFLITFFQASFEVIMKITMFIIKLAPIGILGIVSKVVADQSDISELFKTLGFYMLVVIAGLFAHAFIVLPLILRIVGKVNPLKHFKALTTPLLTAFSTASSNATLPLTLTAVEQNAGVSNKISSFTLPLGATINMDGTALYEVVVVMFLAQALGYDLTVAEQLMAVVIALLTSIGAAGIPMASLVMITVILTALKMPLDAIGIILAVDRILDMFRTAVNVWSDSCAAVLVAKSEGEKLQVDIKSSQ